MGSPGFQLTIHDRPEFLHVVVTGEKDSYDVTMGAMTELAAVCRRRRATRLLLEHRISGKLSTLEIFKIASQLPDLYHGIYVGFVVHVTTSPDNPEFLRNVANNRGGRGRLFDNAADAEAWLLTLKDDPAP